MNWINRYVNAVSSYLPAPEQADVGAELYSLMEEQAVAQQQEQGRPLSQSQQFEIMRAMGRPIVVAARYGSQSELIGETVFPFYKQVLKLSALVILTLMLTGHLLRAIGAGDLLLGQFIVAVLNGSLETFVWVFFWVTLIFYLGQQKISDYLQTKHWDPKSLPSVEHNWVHISLSSAIVNIAVGIAFLNLINAWLVPENLGLSDDFSLFFNAELIALRPWINGIVVASIILSVYQLYSPYWSKSSLLATIIISTLTLLAINALVQMDAYISLQAEVDLKIVQFLQRVPSYHGAVVRGGLLVFALFCVFDIIRSGYRYRLLHSQ